MALSEQEREWLERRKILCNRCVKAAWCRTGEKHGYNTERCRFWELKAPNQRSTGNLDEDFQDAAEFEARVAERLAKPREELRPKGCSWYEKNADGHLVRKTACPPHRDIDNCPGVATCAIYHARIAVQAEMDTNNQGRQARPFLLPEGGYMKVFISQPMQGKTKEEIEADSSVACQMLELAGHTAVHELTDIAEPDNANKALWCLGMTIAKLSTCDALLYLNEWHGVSSAVPRECKVEMKCAELYGIPVYKGDSGLAKLCMLGLKEKA